jgi:hypothetical protein
MREERQRDLCCGTRSFLLLFYVFFAAVLGFF